MTKKFAAMAVAVGIAAAVPAMAKDHGNSRGGQGYSGRSQYAAGSRYSGGGSRGWSGSTRGYSGSSRGYSSGFVRGYSYGRTYVAPRSYGRPYYYYPRPYRSGGVYLQFGAPAYSYSYDPYVYGYSAAPVYTAPGYGYAQQPDTQACGGYDQNGNWVADPNCAAGQQPYQYQQQQGGQAYDPQQYPQGQQQYPQGQQGYPNAQPYPQGQPNYPDAQQYPQPQQNYYPNQRRQ